MKLWLALLLGFFAFAVDDPKDPPVDDPKDPPEPEPDPELDFGGDDPDPAPQDDPADDPKALLEVEKRARADAEARAEQYQRDLAEARANNRPATQTDEQRLFAREQAKLDDPKTPELERWQIDANRKMRSNTSSSQAALMQANDIADRTSFRQLEVTKPALFKRYEKRVEEQLAIVRKQGGNTTREGIMRYLIGSDAMEGKLAAKKKPASDGADLPRGKLPGAKSDVRGKTVMSEREKRAARLEGQQI